MLTTILLAVALQWPLDETVLDPIGHVSPSGAFVLHVDPSARDGAGSSQCRLTRDGDVVWERELPFTLREAAVTDSGFAVGFALTAGDRYGGELVVAVLEPDGELVLDERTARVSSMYFCTSDSPRPHDLVVDGTSDRFVVRVYDESVDDGTEVWWRYRLSTGERLDALVASHLLSSSEEGSAYVQSARALPGTGLTLVHGHVFDAPNDLDLFLLLDQDDAIVWSRAAPLGPDLGVASNEHASSVDADGVFRIWLARDAERVELRAEPDTDAATGWRIEELRRGTWSPPLVEKAPAPQPIALASRSVVELDGAAALGELGATGIFAGRVYVQDMRTAALHAWTDEGVRLFVGASEAQDAELADRIGRIVHGPDGTIWVGARSDRSLVWDAGGRWLGYREHDDIVFVPGGGGAWTWDRIELVRRDAGGAKLERLARRPDRRWLRSVQDVSFGPDGTLAVLDRDAVALWSASGEPLATHALSDWMHRVHVGRTWLVASSVGAAVLLVHRATGEVRAHTVPGARARSSWTHGLSADGERLLSLDRGSRVLHHFALP